MSFSGKKMKQSGEKTRVLEVVGVFLMGDLVEFCLKWGYIQVWIV